MAERILVCDDSRELRTLLAQQLQKLGFDCKSAIDGQDAIARAQEFLPDLIIMDINMPKLNGLAVTRKLRENPKLKHTPIILLSNFGEEGDVIAGIEAGADEYLVKPFRQGELAAKVRILLRKSSHSAKKLDETTVQGLDVKDPDTAMRRFKETGQIVSREFAGFTIIDKLGQGGTAVVYRAMEPMFNKPVALKVISPFAAVKEGFLKRLQRSNEISVKLIHKHIVRTYLMGEYQGVHFMMQELVEGAPLDSYLEEGHAPMVEAEARKYIKQVASALAYLEERKLIHRDIKPGNIYCSREGEAKLGDFGLSRLADDAAQTAEGYLLGTPHYISPEQANGSKDLDMRSDLYSLGATFFHLLSGRPVFEGDSLQQVVLAHLSKQPPKLKEFAPKVSEGFCAVIDKLLDNDRAMRYQHASEVVAALDALPAA
ncbi:MAG: response regulator [Planctomycetes bacterium]|jgi:DNA-binding response OmpR family regulator|nr:response regulator [Planctomycetota bacterium]